jgi:hypothetical protein
MARLISGISRAGTFLKAGRAVARVYQSLWMKGFPRQDRIATSTRPTPWPTWLTRAHLNGSLQFLHPVIAYQEEQDRYGWISGVV